MSRIVAIDYGTKRVGIAVTDPNKIIATALATIHSKDVIEYLKNYHLSENIECFVIGEPKRLNNMPSDVEKQITPFITKLSKEFPGIPIERIDERFTSKMAFQSMIDGGVKKKNRQNKSTLDKISATLILQSFLALKS